MAIVRQSVPAPAPENSIELGLTINNGDFQALKKTVERLGFKDEESMFRFALAVLAQSATRSLKVTDTNGKEVTLNPSETLLKPTPVE